MNHDEGLFRNRYIYKIELKCVVIEEGIRAESVMDIDYENELRTVTNGGSYFFYS